MSEDLDLGVAAVAALLAGVALLVVLRRRGSRRPPCATGWIPWVGAGLRFGKAPLEFIEQARARLLQWVLPSSLDGKLHLNGSYERHS